MPSTPVTFRLDQTHLNFLKEYAQSQTLKYGKTVSVSDLIKGAVESKYPVPQDFKTGDMLFLSASGIYCNKNG
jgi:hypothetical protein